MKKSKKIILVSVISIIIIVLFFIVLNWIWNFTKEILSPAPTELKYSLPSTATDISDKFIDIFPDWEYYLKAKITQEEFYNYINELGLKIISDRKMATLKNIKIDSTKDYNEFKDSVKSFDDYKKVYSCNTKGWIGGM
ncbi:MAG: hypothetical protein NTU73_05925 [Ignavibacteriae bacterium]|nr:hypothetical protein [Ignavibacteriota bacterium]